MSDDDDPWRAPAPSEPPAGARQRTPEPGPEEALWTGASWAGLFAVVVAHVLVALGVTALGDAIPLNWPAAFGIFQLTFLVPLVAILVWRGAPRQAVVGVLVGAGLAFLANGAFIAIVGWDALGV